LLLTHAWLIISCCRMTAQSLPTTDHMEYCR
jgi:hypothetical protein